MRPLERHPRAGRPPRRHARRIHPLVALRRRPRLRWLAVVVLAALAAASVHSLAASAEAERARWGPSRTVAVAARDLAPGQRVEARDVVLRALPSAALPDGTLAEAPHGRVVTARVLAGEPLAEARLAPSGLSEVAALVPPGSRAVAVPVAAGTTPPLVTGDVVDVLVASDPSSLSSRPPLVAARRATVVDVSEVAVTVAVPEPDAARIALAAATGLAALALAGA